MSVPDTIRDWFNREFGGSLLLPDGWYGRPFDNQHRLTEIGETNNETTLVLDELITLRFRGLAAAKVCDRDLVLGPFQTLNFTARPYGGVGSVRSTDYVEGEVKLIAAPG